MKYFFSFFLLWGIFGDVVLSENNQNEQHNLQGVPEIIENMINSTMNIVKKILPDPLSIPKVNVSFDAGIIANGSFMIDNVLETGAKGFVVEKIETRILSSTLNVIINVPNINVNGKYFLDLLLGTIVPLYGEGPFNVHLKNLQFNLTAGYTLNVLRLKLQIHDTYFVTTLEDAVFDLHGALDNEAFSVLLDEVMNDNVDVFIDEQSKLISKFVSPILEKIVNSVLSRKKSLMGIDENDISLAGYELIEELKQHPEISKLVQF